MKKKIYRYSKIIVGSLALAILIVTIYHIYITYINLQYEESKHIKLDEYNFQQLEKIIKVEKTLNISEYSFQNLMEFNKIFETNIQPINNCYYIGNDNGNQKYIFGFKLYSDKYIKKHKSDFYAYPKYAIKPDYMCGGGDSCDIDLNFMSFQKIISNPCK